MLIRAVSRKGVCALQAFQKSPNRQPELGFQGPVFSAPRAFPIQVSSELIRIILRTADRSCGN